MHDTHLNEKKAYIDSKLRPDNFVFRPSVSIVILVATLGIDYMVMSKFFYDLRYADTLMPTIGVLFAIDIMPFFLIPAYKYIYSKVERPPYWLLILATAIIICTMAVVVGVKVNAMDRLNESRRVPITVPQILLEALIPLGTSTGNALIAWHSFQPLKKYIARAARRKAELEFRQMQVHSHRAKYDSCSRTTDYRVDLERQVARKYMAARGKIDAIVQDLKVYFRNRLAERLADPRSASQLSQMQVDTSIPYVKLPDSVSLSDIYENSPAEAQVDQSASQYNEITEVQPNDESNEKAA